MRAFRAIATWFSGRSPVEIQDSSTPPEGPAPGLGQFMLPGNLIDMKQLREDAALRGEINPDIVPRNWQLVETSALAPSASGARVLAKGVVAFHVSARGEIYYSDGSAIYRLPAGDGDHKPGVVEEVHNVQQIVAL